MALIAQPSSNALFDQIQAASTGYRSVDVLQALLDSVAQTIAYMVEDQDQANNMIDSLPRDLKRAVRDRWVLARRLRSQGARVGGHGHG